MRFARLSLGRIPHYPTRATPRHSAITSSRTVRLRTEIEYDNEGRKELERTNIVELNDGTPRDYSAAQTTSYAYNPQGNHSRTTFTDGSSVSYGYDDFGRRAAETDQLGLTKNLEYDAAGRLNAVVLPQVPDLQNNNALTRPRYEYSYDAQGNQTTIRDPLGRETRFTFDARGNPLTRTLPLGVQTTGDPDDFQERFEYDNRGRQVLHVSFEEAVKQSVYDPLTGRLVQDRFFDNLVAYNNGAGTPAEVWSYTHDALGRVVQVTQSAGSQVRTVTTAYDAEGRVTAISSPEGIVRYEYDNLGRRTRTYTIDPANPQNVVSDVRYAYDAVGRLQTVAVHERNDQPLATPETTVYGYDLVGRLDRTDLPNGVVEDYVYDTLGGLDLVTHYGPDATPANLSDNPQLSRFDYSVRADGKRTGASEYRDGVQTASFRWEYDDVGRLVEEALDSFTDNSLDYTARYGFDLAGNRLTKSLWKTAGTPSGTPDELTGYAYDANDRLLEETLDLLVGNDRRSTYAWGTDGSATFQTGKTVTDLATSQPIQQTTYGYNLQGRLRQATVTSYTGSLASRIERTTYGYAASGIRVSALHEIDATADGAYESATRTEYLNDPHNHSGYSQVLRESALDPATGTVQKAIDYVFGHDEISQTTTTYSGGVATGAETLFFTHDGHGSVRALVNAAGAVATVSGIPQLFTYDAYGNPIGFNHAIAATNLLYSGEQWDQRVAMQYLRARFYDPSAGRLDRIDAYAGDVRDPQSLHKFLYGHDDPIGNQDPTGMFSVGASLGGLSGLNAFKALTNLSAGNLGGNGPKFLSSGGEFEDIDDLIDELTLSAEMQLDHVRKVFTVGAGLAAVAARYAIAMTEFMMDHFAFDDPLRLALSWVGARACFVAGTRVVVGVNESGGYLTKPIEQLGVGDSVLSRDDDSIHSPVNTGKVTRAFERIVEQILAVTISDRNGQSAVIKTTNEHPFWVNGNGWTLAVDLRPGRAYALISGRKC